MIRFEPNEFTKKQMLAGVAGVLLLLAVQFFLIKSVRTLYTEVQVLKHENSAMQAELDRKSDSIVLYKSTVKLDRSSLPVPAESATKFYSALLSILSANGFDGAEVVKASSDETSVSFTVGAEADYFALLRLLSSLRQGPYMVRLTSLDVAGGAEGNVKFSFTIQSRISAVTANAAASDEAEVKR